MLASMVAMAGAVAVVLVCSYALIAGSWRERFGALVYLTAYLIVLGFGSASPVSMLMADTLCIPGFFIANWKSRHPWPRWALTGQLLSVSIELIALFPSNLSRWTFLTIEVAAGWAVLLSILVGTIAYRVERRTQNALGR